MLKQQGCVRAKYRGAGQQLARLKKPIYKRANDALLVTHVILSNVKRFPFAKTSIFYLPHRSRRSSEWSRWQQQQRQMSPMLVSSRWPP